LRAINTANASYSSAAGQGRYSTHLKVLGAACPGSAEGLISRDLGAPRLPVSVRHAGSTLLPAGAAAGAPGPNDCNGTATQTDFYATSVPVTVGTTGNRGFSSNAAGA